jgi:hypothetical protein
LADLSAKGVHFVKCELFICMSLYYFKMCSSQANFKKWFLVNTAYMLQKGKGVYAFIKTKGRRWYNKNVG